jgi:hypothetical protein
MTDISSTGSIQNAVLAIPPQLNVPVEHGVFAFA